MNEKGFVIAWYYHLPSVSTDDEVIDLIRTSLSPLLSLHRKYKRPFTLAITGSLLKRINSIDDDVLELIKELIKNEILEIAATFYYEIFPSLIPYEYIKLHVKNDIETKKDLFGIKPLTFYPPNFSWVSILNYLLLDYDIYQIILDEGHFKLCFKPQVWRWNLQNSYKMKSVLIDVPIFDKESYQIYSYKEEDLPNNDGFKLFFRSFEVVKHLSFGNSGLFHKPFEWDSLERYVKGLISKLEQGNYITLADDGDRINPVSLYNYSKFLESFDDVDFVTPSSIKYSYKELPRINYLPSYSLGDLQSFWLNDIDSVHYFYMLNYIYNLQYCFEGCSEKFKYDIMEIQDVYFSFWKTISRKKYYMKKLYNILKGLEECVAGKRLSFHIQTPVNIDSL